MPDEHVKNVERSVRGFPKAAKPKLPEMTVREIFGRLKKGRSVLVVFQDATDRMKYSKRITEAALAFLDKEPHTTIPNGPNIDNSVYITDGVWLGFTKHTAEDEDIWPLEHPHETDVVIPLIPDEWK